MGSGFSINKPEIARMMREIQREFNKHPVRVPVETDPEAPMVGGTTYNGPVINITGNGAQVAWNNRSVNQNQGDQHQQIAPGFEPLAQAVASTLQQLPHAGLANADQQDAEAAANEVLTEVTQAEPDRGKIRRALAALKGLLAPVAMGLVTGAGEGAQDWAKTAVEQLGTPF
jgi:hypothetical protein